MLLIQRISLFFFTMIIVARLSDDLEEILRAELNKRFAQDEHGQREVLVLLYINALEVELADKGYNFSKYLGQGTYGIVLQATKADSRFEKIAVKIAHLEDGKICDRNIILDEHKDKQDSQLIRMIENFEFETTVKYVREKDLNGIQKYEKITAEESSDNQLLKKRFSKFEIETISKKFCVLALEGAEQDLTKPLFTKNDTDKAQNSKVLGYVFYRLIEGFYKFNFEEKYLHGDIKEANLVVVKSAKYKFEPKIIDFDLTCKPSSPEEKKVPTCDGKITYTLAYRAPELKFFCPDTNCKYLFLGNAKIRRLFFIDYYSYSHKYKEDAFALGVTLEKVFETNKAYIDVNDKFLDFLFNEVFSKMLYIDPEERISTQAAYTLVKNFVETNNWSFRINSSSDSIEPTVISFGSGLLKLHRMHPAMPIYQKNLSANNSPEDRPSAHRSEDFLRLHRNPEKLPDLNKSNTSIGEFIEEKSAESPFFKQISLVKDDIAKGMPVDGYKKISIENGKEPQSNTSIRFKI